MALTFLRVPFRWWAAASLVALGAVAGYSYARLAHPAYTAKSYVTVVAVNQGDAGAIGYAEAYARIAGQGDVQAAATQTVASPISVTELADAVRAASTPDAPVIEITATAPTAERAAQLANAMSAGLVVVATRQTPATRMTVTPLSFAVPPTRPTSPPSPAVATAIGSAAGVLLAGVLLLSTIGRRPRPSGRRAPAPVPPLPLWTERASRSPEPRGPSDGPQPAW
jgi:capsular polysaccharide biosynthesis protein